ncbi:MAG: hypothetical protein MUE87_06275, partial [Methanothrix sp.]|nr:hypothetical protein [Methanothrix sp.]
WYFGNRRLALWDCETGMQKAHIDLNDLDWKLAPLLAISDDGSVVVSATEYDHKLLVWHVGGNHAKIPANQSLGHKGRVCGLAITPDGSKAVSISGDIYEYGELKGELKLWNLVANSLEKTFSGHICSNSDAIAISDDGKWAASVHSGLNLEIWDLENGTGPIVIANNTQDELHTGSITSLCIFETSEGLRVLTGSNDKTVKYWNAASGRLIRTFSGHVMRVTAVAVTEDMAISSSDDRTIRIWRKNPNYFRAAEGLPAFERLTSYAVYQLSENLFTGGIDGLLSLASQKASELNFWETYQPNEEPNVVLVPKNLEINGALFENPIKNTIDFKGTYRLYYEEVFFHIPFLIANKLNSNQAFEEAQKWYHYIFNPTANDAADGSGKDRYWKYLPFKKDSFESLKKLLTDGPALAAYREDPFDPHAIAALRMAAYKKAVVMKYIDNLLDWGDALFMQDSRESINEATGLYALGYDLLGPRPRSKTIKRFEEIGTYEEFIQDYDEDSEFLVEVEKMASSSAGPVAASPHRNIITDFCVPENAKFIGYWDLVEDRLFKIRHSQNIEGIYRQLALFSPTIEPMDLVRAVAAGAGIGGALAELNVAVPHYRYPIVVGLAKEMAGNAISLGSALLDAIEKRDAEKLANLQNTQERIILNLMTSIKEEEIEEVEKEIEALNESKRRSESKRDRYKKLKDNGNLYGEDLEIVYKYISAGLRGGEALLKLAKGIASIWPQLTSGGAGVAGSPVTTASMGPKQWAAVAEAGGDILECLSEEMDRAGEAAAQVAEYQRRDEEWEFERDQSDSEAIEIQSQIDKAKISLETSKRELAIHKRTIDQNMEIGDFYRSKFSNESLYNWMVGKLSTLYFQSYKTAYDMAKSAEKCLQYEIPSTTSYITPTHWDGLKKGLLAGESLLLQIDQMEKSHLAQDSRFIEIEKTISMNNTYPGALLLLLAKGACEFKLGEEIFDRDYPGHYFRVIKTIELTIVTQRELEPYQSVNVTLIQLGNKTLLTP